MLMCCCRCHALRHVYAAVMLGIIPWNVYAVLFWVSYFTTCVCCYVRYRVLECVCCVILGIILYDLCMLLRASEHVCAAVCFQV